MPDRTPPPAHPPLAYPFLTDGGALGQLIAEFNWSRTGVGAIEHWPAHMRAAISLMLRCKIPMAMLWGEDGILIYNDAYGAFSGTRHPQLLGSKVREAWPEAVDFNNHVLKVGLAGGNLSYQDQEFTLSRHGRAEKLWLNLDYSPLLDDLGQPVGVMALVVETTSKVRAEARLSSERERFAQLFEQAPTFMVMLAGPEHRIELANPNYLRLIGHRPVLGRTVAEALPDAAEQGYVDLLDQVFRTGEAFSALGSKYAVQVEPGGEVDERYLDFVFQPIRDASGAVSGIFVEGVDVTERAAAGMRNDALARLADDFRDLVEPADLAFVAARMLGGLLGVSRVGYGTIAHDTPTLHVVRDWNAPGVLSLAGDVNLREYGSFIDDLQRGEFVAVTDARTDPRTANAVDALEERSARSFLNVPVIEQDRLAAVFFVNHREAREWSDAECAFVREVGERTRTAVERARGVVALRDSEAALRVANETLEAKVAQRTQELVEAEARFRQAQKMEAIGQLTGGIAHDFNNLLASMSASLQVLQKRLNAGKPEGADRYIEMSQESVRRAASLTQRLLAFSRRQTLDPKPTEVNRLVAGLEDLIRRTVGPAVELEVVGAGGLWLSKVDPPQLESSILNLCINARDAMAPAGGRLTIETANKWLDDRGGSERELPPGQYISVCVTDTGTGMSPDTIARAFDPFFTTKPVGKGTGLGLSMVYGFVRQSGGQVRVYSEVGRGTTMCLYLPRFIGESEREPDPVGIDGTALGHIGDGECVLVVEDEATIRTVIAEELRERGYRVLAVGDGPSALEVLQSDARIDLLLSDVGLPGGLNGRQVADAARVTRPALQVLFLTGYAENAAVGNGLLEHGMAVLTKPFDVEALVNKVREMVER